MCWWAGHGDKCSPFRPLACLVFLICFHKYRCSAGQCAGAELAQTGHTAVIPHLRAKEQSAWKEPKANTYIFGSWTERMSVSIAWSFGVWYYLLTEDPTELSTYVCLPLGFKDDSKAICFDYQHYPDAYPSCCCAGVLPIRSPQEA